MARFTATVEAGRGAGTSPLVMPKRLPAQSPANHALDRRRFLGVSAGTALLCGLGGRPLSASTAAEVDEADAAARALPRPKAATKDPIDSARYETPQPQPGGKKREYWIAARSTTWNIAPTGRDEWMNHAVKGKKKFRALVYQLYREGFTAPIGPAEMPARCSRPRWATRSSSISATPTRASARRSPCTRTGSATTPSTTVPT